MDEAEPKFSEEKNEENVTDWNQEILERSRPRIQNTQSKFTMTEQNRTEQIKCY